MAGMTQKKLVRPRSNRVLAGVAMGIAEYFDADVTVIRLLLAFLVIFTGFAPGIVLYLAAWIIMPEAA